MSWNVARLREALEDMPGDAVVKLSGDSTVYGDGCTMFDPEQGPGVENVSMRPFAGGQCCVIWPDQDGWPDG